MVNELQAVARELGGRRTLGRVPATDHDLREAIRKGFPPAVVEALMRASGLTLKELANALDLSPRSLQRRRRSGRLALYESDRLYRLARIVAIANEYLGDHQRAMRWLKRPNRALGGLAPVAAIDTELGARQVENILGRIAYGGISGTDSTEFCARPTLALRSMAREHTAMAGAGRVPESVSAIRLSMSPLPCWSISSISTRTILQLISS